MKQIRVSKHDGSFVVELSEELFRTKDLRRRIHDVKSSTRTMNLCIEAIMDGYRFDDELASAKLDALRKALAAINEEANLLSEIYLSCLESKI